MNRKRITFWASAVLYSLNLIIIGIISMLNPPLDQLLKAAGKAALIAVPVGIFLAWFQNWAMAKQPNSENGQNT